MVEAYFRVKFFPLKKTNSSDSNSNNDDNNDFEIVKK